MCVVLVNKHVFKLRNNSLALVAKGKGSTFVGTIIQAPEASRRRFPIGTRVIFKNEMGHVLCEGNDHNEQDKCLLHELDAVIYQGTGVRFKDLIERAKKKVKGRVILTVSAGEDQVGEKAEGEAPKKDEPKEVVAEKVVKYADLKPGQKFRHLNVRGLFQKTDVPAGQFGETVMVDPEGDLYRSKGQKFRTWPTDDVILVA